MSKLRVLELFSGIGALSKALEKLGIDHEIVDAVEIDKYAVKSFNAIHNTNFEPQDICEWDKDIEVDLIMHGSPCQDFSLAGKQAGGDKDSGTRSSLMYETIRIVEKLKPKYVIWENVKNLLSKKHRHNFDAYLETMEQLGYKNYYQVLNAKDYGIPQNRERVFTISILGNENYEFPKIQVLKKSIADITEKNVAEKYYIDTKWLRENKQYDDKTICETRYDEGIRTFKDNICGSLRTIDGCGNKCLIEHFQFPSKQELKLKLKDMLEDEVDEKYYLSETTSGENDRGVVVNKTVCLNSKGGRNGIEGLQPSLKDRIYDSNGIATCCATSNFFMPNYTDGLRIRKLTPKECWRLMGFDDEDYEKAVKVNSNAQLYKQAGNSIVVNVLEAILKELLLNE